MPALQKLEELLLIEMSRRNTDLIAGLVDQKPELFGELFGIFAGNKEPVSRRAAWVIDTVSEKHPELIAPYLNDLVRLLPVFKHDGLKRHSLRMLARSPLPCESRLGELVNICFEWFSSPNQATAIRVYCMEILYRVSQIEPELKKELADTIRLRLNEASAGVKNRGHKLAEKLFAEMQGPIKP